MIALSPPKLLRRSLDVHVTGLQNGLRAMEKCCPRARLFYAASSHVFGTPGQNGRTSELPLPRDPHTGSPRQPAFNVVGLQP